MKKIIENYGIDLEDDLEDVSPFEYNYTFHTRDFLAKEYCKLDDRGKEQLLNYDQVLLERAQDLYQLMSLVMNWEDNVAPINYWWWHLDKVITGKMKVLVEKNHVQYQGETYTINTIS
ncbi:hypothetical protein [Hazenella coriacea]|uniref:Uncharacterized protein n=1 Tax=Hazenella coriacea TaxID=1179467 RepID=A0A4R3LAT9_9BACL|nr:hypothetical protein [Hazenella coriacea]TCS96869.1 hypothetical protein EDD58_101514 [Hazenella coriacea]